MVAAFFGRNYNTETLRQIIGYGKEGVNMLGISEAAEGIGFRTRGVHLSFLQLAQEAPLPTILHWSQNHFVVLISVKKKFSGYKIKIADPAKGVITLNHKEFLAHWISTKSEQGEDYGTALLLETTEAFYEQSGESENKIGWGVITRYLLKHKKQFGLIFIALLLTSGFQLIFPFLTQSIVDTGINAKNLSYITVVLCAQLMLVFSRTFIDFIRARILMRISISVNFSLLSDFWIKLTKLPISYFDSFHTGDTLQRLRDARKIENFLTGNALNTFFSLFTFIAFAFVLIQYNIQLFLIFGVGSVIYYIWIHLFLKIRRKVNYQTFNLSARENNISLQLVQGMQELKLNKAEHLKRWEWENTQAGIFQLSIKNLSYNQLQQAGALFINEGKNVVITFYVAQMVVSGQLTLGAMLAVQYIIGQLNGPIEQFIGFVQSAQDAKISLERLNEIHHLKDEENYFSDKDNYRLRYLPEHRSIKLTNLSFSYPNAGDDPVLKNLNLIIPQGKVTAIVGASGSGKTTLLKLLLKFYESYEGEISLSTDSNDIMSENAAKFKFISPSFWRNHCGVVFQDGYIFNDSIARNIGVSDESPDFKKLINACKIANILSFIESLPNGFNTKLGTDGTGISQGQKQRLLIARAVYKDPEYLFFDEATNALDANNELVIVRNLNSFYKGRTVIVVAHRLSTVKNADKIIVLDKGKIIEEGTHQYLTNLRGHYYELVKNQLELGN